MNSGPLTIRPPVNLAMGDDRAFSRTAWLTNEFRASYAWLKSKLHRRLGSHADAEDLASSSFAELAAVEDLNTVREPRAFLTIIAQRLTFEMWRRRDLERAYLDSLAFHGELMMPSAENLVELTQALVLIDRMLDGLSENTKSAFIYSQVDGLTYAEIANLLGVSSSMVRKYVARALEKCYQIA